MSFNLEEYLSYNEDFSIVDRLNQSDYDTSSVVGGVQPHNNNHAPAIASTSQNAF
jgi:hypothetical protein